MFDLLTTNNYDETYANVTKRDKILQKRVQKALKLLRQDPFHPSLKSHKVATRNFGERWSSWITGDLRIIWDFDEEQRLTILLLALTEHSGTHREYK